MTAPEPTPRFASPNFAAPPLLEVALAVEFMPIADFGAFAMSELATSWRDRYPHVEEHAPLPPGSVLGAPPTPGVVVNVGAPQLRLWCVNASGDRVVQVQRDRLIVNWRAAFDGGPYPRYEQSLRPEFGLDLADLVSFVRDRCHVPIIMTTSEATYVNDLTKSGSTDLVGTLRSQNPVEHHLGAPAGTRLDQTWIRFEGDHTVGLVTASADTGGDRSLLTITARSTVETHNSTESVLESLDVAHQDVVTTFLELTSLDAQTTWGRSS